MNKKQQPTDRKRGVEGGSAKAPDVARQRDMRSIKSVNLSLHGDAISHWQDEPRGAESQAAKKSGRPRDRNAKGGSK